MYTVAGARRSVGRSVASCYAVKLRRASDSGGVRILNSRLWAGLASRRCRSNSRPSVRSNTVKQASAAAAQTYRIAAAFAGRRAGGRRGQVPDAAGWVGGCLHCATPDCRRGRTGRRLRIPTRTHDPQLRAWTSALTMVPISPVYRERKFADTTGTVLVPWAGHFQC